jgi:hypothetical protein
MLKKRADHFAKQGQATLEGMLVIGMVLIPLMIASLKWVQIEWKKSEVAFQNFKSARIEMIRTQQKSNHQGIELHPLEDLDRNKKQLGLTDLLNEASLLLDLLLS